MIKQPTSVTPTQTAEVLGTCRSNANTQGKSHAQTGHTPGPWQKSGEYVNPLPDNYSNETGQFDSICFCYGHNKEANACLIAAAPELLKACKRLVRIAQGCGYSELDLRDAIDSVVCAAIAKAEGKTNE